LTIKIGVSLWGGHPSDNLTAIEAHAKDLKLLVLARNCKIARDVDAVSPQSLANRRSASWVIRSTDVGKAKAFYGKLFDWKLEDMDMGDMTYTMIKVGEGTGGGFMKNPMPNAGSMWVA
jgi:hypothetical protein